jgi:hypothetical protein
MTRQLPRPYSSSARLTADVRPPAPGQAYFGYPQPARSAFPVPQQTASIFEPVPMEQPRFEQAPVRPAPAPNRPTMPGNRQPSHAVRKPTRSPNWRHFVGYPLAVILGVLIGVGVAVISGLY